MDILYTRERATAAQVMESLADPPGYSAVRALLRILEDKGHIRHRPEGARYVYVPRESPATARRSALKRIVSVFFQGSIAQAMAALLETADTHLSAAELDQLQHLIKEARKEGR